MSIGWSSLPLLPLQCILDHLSTEDALSALSVCRHWRTAILLYEGRKDTLKLQAKHLEKSIFAARVFRKYVKRLHLHLDCGDEQLESFLNYMLPQFFDSVQLQEVLFIGPSFLELDHQLNMPVVKLKRSITESLVLKHLHSLRHLAIFGCDTDGEESDHGKCTHKQVECYPRAHPFNNEPSPADSILSSRNTSGMVFSTLQHIAVDYEQINTDALETLSHLPMFTHLTMNIGNRKDSNLAPVEWDRLVACYPNGFDVSVNIVTLPYKKFNEVIENVLVEGLNLTSLKVMFCKTIYTPLITHIVRVYKATLRELVWVDSPYETLDPRHRVIRPSQQGYDTRNVNPFILLCWQCVELRRLVIHGYWMWQYDILGFVRLRNRLRLEISAWFSDHNRFWPPMVTEENISRVLTTDGPMSIDQDFVQQVNSFTSCEWTPVSWSQLHPALRARADSFQKADYARTEALRGPPDLIHSANNN